MKTNIGGTTIIQYAFHYCKKCKSTEYTDGNKCKKCNNDYVLLEDYLKSDTDELLEDEKMAQERDLTPLESNAVQVALDHMCEFLECSVQDAIDDEEDDAEINELKIKLNATESAKRKFDHRKDDSCDECGGDGFLEYDESSKKEGEVIESYGKEECNKCNGKGII